jgi:uncharacterized protein (DUF885 family)
MNSGAAMFLRKLLATVLIACTFISCTNSTTDTDPDISSVFHALLDDHWAAATAEKVFFRTDPDGWRMDGALSEHTAEARNRRQQFNEQILTRLAAIDMTVLGVEDRMSYRIFRYERETERQSYLQPEHYFPINSLFGYHTYFAEAPASTAFLSAQDYENYLVSLADFTRFNRDYIEVMREAIAAGYTHYCESISKYAKTIDVHIVSDVESSGLFVPFTRFPGSVNEDQRARFVSKGSELIRSVVVPGYQELLDFFGNEYLPACRNDVAITSLPDGDEYYQYLINYYTTIDMAPAEIHELGLAELDRIRVEMQAIIDDVSFEGDFRAFADYLREAPQFYAKSDQELLGRAALISKTAEGELPRFFTRLPRTPYTIVGDANRGAYYKPSSGDGTDSGTYFVKTGDLENQPLYTLESLSLHEGVPGHHLQNALAQEQDLPAFRRSLNHSGFGEGWGLYAERLGKEMGFYQDPYSDFGRLTYEAWRACRLVVDTGMHAFGWSRQQGIDFMMDNTAESITEVTKEIDRYITWPAQALSYKIGELKIRELRARAESELGTEFDIRRFHDVVIGNGSLPIAVLEDIIVEWIAAEKR